MSMNVVSYHFLDHFSVVGGVFWKADYQKSIDLDFKNLYGMYL